MYATPLFPTTEHPHPIDDSCPGPIFLPIQPIQDIAVNAKQYGEGDKLALYGLFKQSKWGDCPAALVSAQRDNPIGSVKVRAWLTNRGKPTGQAMEEFVAVLGRVSITASVEARIAGSRSGMGVT